MTAVYEDRTIQEVGVEAETVAAQPRRYPLDYLIVGAATLHGAADLYAVWVALGVGVIGDWLVVRLLSWPVVILTLLIFLSVRRRR